MAAKTLMIVGTTSHAGKSLIATGFCRLFKEAGFSVAPFKAQNMSNNSFVTESGGEMGRAQVGQAEAAGVSPHTDMNPVLLKPTSDQGSQVVVQGKPIGTMKATEYYQKKKQIWQSVTESYERLKEKYDIIVMEGAGSPVEVNIRDKDIVNMPMAIYANAPTILVADIERGGVFASAIGTYALLSEEEKNLMCGTIINKFRGDVSLFADGPGIIEKHTSKPVLGVLPYLQNLIIDEEDGVSIDKFNRFSEDFDITVSIIALPRISNLTDFSPFRFIPGVRVNTVKRAEDLNDTDCIIIPGTKSTLQDLEWLKESGIAERITDLHLNNNIPVLGICGGYQMLSNSLKDPDNTEGAVSEVKGLGLINADTIFFHESAKTTTRIKASALENHPFLDLGTMISGYEIHSGQTVSKDSISHKITESIGDETLREVESDGCSIVKPESFIFGTYIHGFFDQKEVLEQFINKVRSLKNLPAIEVNKHLENMLAERDKSYSILAEQLRNHLDLEYIKNSLGINKL
ncbi:MAG: cobyric acid synthase [Planctomycetota bacterium]|jgi:adenosylcobyric acid synthase